MSADGDGRGWRALLCFHAFNIATDTRDVLFDLEDFDDIPGALLKDGTETSLGFARVLQANRARDRF